MTGEQRSNPLVEAEVTGMIATKDSHTETAGTAITEIFPPISNRVCRIERVCYSAGTTAHTLTVLRVVGRTATTSAAVSGGTTLDLAKADPGVDTNGDDETLAANDYLAWIDETGVIQFDTVSSISGATVTLSNALPTDVHSGTIVWAFYETGRATHLQFTLRASAVTEIIAPIQAGFSRQQGVKTERSGIAEPLLMHIDNATNAGELLYANARYINWSSNQVAG